jgi:hypothetical protein
MTPARLERLHVLTPKLFLIAEYDASAEVHAAGRTASPDDGHDSQHGHVTVAVNDRQLSKSSQTRLGR